MPESIVLYLHEWQMQAALVSRFCLYVSLVVNFERDFLSYEIW